MYAYLVCATYFFAQASKFTRGRVSWGSFMTGDLKTAQMNYKALMLCEFSDYGGGATIVSKLSLRSLCQLSLQLV